MGSIILWRGRSSYVEHCAAMLSSYTSNASAIWILFSKWRSQSTGLPPQGTATGRLRRALGLERMDCVIRSYAFCAVDGSKGAVSLVGIWGETLAQHNRLWGFGGRRAIIRDSFTIIRSSCAKEGDNCSDFCSEIC